MQGEKSVSANSVLSRCHFEPYIVDISGREMRVSMFDKHVNTRDVIYIPDVIYIIDSVSPATP